MNNKKRVVISYHNLTPELQAELKKAHPGGFTDHLLRIEKAPGNFFCAVVFETPDVNYLVKVDVKVDGNPGEDDDKDFYEDDMGSSDDEISDRSNDEDSDEE